MRSILSCVSAYEPIGHSTQGFPPADMTVTDPSHVTMMTDHLSLPSHQHDQVSKVWNFLSRIAASYLIIRSRAPDSARCVKQGDEYEGKDDEDHEQLTKSCWARTPPPFVPPTPLPSHNLPIISATVLLISQFLQLDVLPTLGVAERSEEGSLVLWWPALGLPVGRRWR